MEPLVLEFEAWSMEIEVMRKLNASEEERKGSRMGLLQVS